jgi:hypothetical protein
MGRGRDAIVEICSRQFGRENEKGRDILSVLGMVTVAAVYEPVSELAKEAERIQKMPRSID